MNGLFSKRKAETFSLLPRAGIPSLGLCFSLLCPAMESDDWTPHRLKDRLLLERQDNCQSVIVETQPLSPLLRWLPPNPVNKNSLNDLPSSVDEQIMLLKSMHSYPEPEFFSPLTRLFFRSRLALTPEDPDVFERSVHILVAHAEKFPEEWDTFRNEKMVSIILEELHQHLQHRWGTDLETEAKTKLFLNHPDSNAFNGLKQDLQKDVTNVWEKYGIKWLEGWRSENGALGMDVVRLGLWHYVHHKSTSKELRELVDQAYSLDKKPTIAPPRLVPSHESGSVPPTESNVEVEHFDAPLFTSNHVMLLVFFFLLSVFGFLYRNSVNTRKFLGSTLITLMTLTSFEFILILLGVQTVAQTQPLFSFQDWQYHLFHDSDFPNISETRGGPARYQWVHRTKQIDLRIGVVGASSAHGSNLLQNETFSGQLETALQTEFPDDAIQVVNGAIGGTTSNGVLSAGLELLEFELDSLILFYGHNEVAQFSHLSFFQDLNIRNLQIRQWLSHSRIYGLLFRLLSPDGAILTVSENSLDEKHNSFEAQQRLRRIAEQNMAFNLQQLIDEAVEQDVEIVVINPTFHFPFVPVEPFPDRNDTPMVQRLLDESNANPSDISLAQIAEGSAVDGSPLDIQARWNIIRAHRQSGAGHLARQAVFDLLDVGTGITTITQNIRALNLSLAQENGLEYLDLEELFYTSSVDGFSANGLFWDELHPSREGHRRIANALFPYFKDYWNNHPCRLSQCARK